MKLVFYFDIIIFHDPKYVNFFVENNNLERNGGTGDVIDRFLFRRKIAYCMKNALIFKLFWRKNLSLFNQLDSDLTPLKRQFVNTLTADLPIVLNWQEDRKRKFLSTTLALRFATEHFVLSKEINRVLIFSSFCLLESFYDSIQIIWSIFPSFSWNPQKTIVLHLQILNFLFS